MYFFRVPTNIGIYYYIDTLTSTQGPSNIQYMMCVCVYTHVTVLLGCTGVSKANIFINNDRSSLGTAKGCICSLQVLVYFFSGLRYDGYY